MTNFLEFKSAREFLATSGLSVEEGLAMVEVELEKLKQGREKIKKI